MPESRAFARVDHGRFEKVTSTRREVAATRVVHTTDTAKCPGRTQQVIAPDDGANEPPRPGVVPDRAARLVLRGITLLQGPR